MTVIGLPRGLYYYQYNALWENFFESIGLSVVVSGETNKDILDCGVRHCSNETCLPVKAFHGHVYSLLDKVDYIFIPRHISSAKNEFTCPKFCALPDMAKLNLKGRPKIIEASINIDKSLDDTYESLKELSKSLNIRYEVVKYAFTKAFNAFNEDAAVSKSNDAFVKDNSKPSISVLGHPYMIYDSYLSMKLLQKLTDSGVTVYTPLNLSHETRRKNAYPYQGKVFWEVGFDNLGSAFTFAGNVDGIIYLTPFACGVDSFVVEFIERKLKEQQNVPFLKLTIDEHTGEAGFDTRVEAFLDMIG